MKKRWRTLLVCVTLIAVQMLSHAESPKIIAASSATIDLESGATRIALQPADTIPRGHLDSYLSGIKERIYLVLHDTEASAQPGVIYNLYLGLPAESKPEKEDTRFIGSLNFYSAVRLEGKARGKSSFRSYEITHQIRKLAAQKLLSGEISITIIPSGIPAPEAKARIGRVELVQQ
jgi:hypothetical protein